jgi:hypothetical protein
MTFKFVDTLAELVKCPQDVFFSAFAKYQLLLTVCVTCFT